MKTLPTECCLLLKNSRKGLKYASDLDKKAEQGIKIRSISQYDCKLS